MADFRFRARISDRSSHAPARPRHSFYRRKTITEEERWFTVPGTVWPKEDSFIPPRRTVFCGRAGNRTIARIRRLAKRGYSVQWIAFVFRVPEFIVEVVVDRKKWDND